MHVKRSDNRNLRRERLYFSRKHRRHTYKTSNTAKNTESVNSILGGILNETDENGLTVSEAIVKSLTDKACSGDLNAIKFLREISDKEEKSATREIIITVVD